MATLAEDIARWRADLQGTARQVLLRAGLRQLAIGAAAVGVTFAVGRLLGVALARRPTEVGPLRPLPSDVRPFADPRHRSSMRG